MTYTISTAAWPRIGDGKTLTEQVYRVMRRRLGLGAVPPGTFLRESELADAMGVSRTPIREALGQLASEGLLERIPNRGFRVPVQSIETLVHLYPVLGALEVLAGELAFPNLSDEDLRQMEEANSRFAAALKSRDISTAVAWNDEFHRRIARRSGNPVLCEVLDELREQVHRLEVWDFSLLLSGGNGQEPEVSMDEWPRQHREILAAIRRRDFETARELLEQNRTLSFAAEMGREQRHDPSPDAPTRASPVAGPDAGLT